MPDIAIAAPAIIVLLGTLIFFHELGHFMVAKLLRIRVEEFAFGFGPKWIRLFKRGDTEYTVHPVPLGGFVKLAGMEPGQENVPDGFQSKPWWGRLLVYLAGPTMSFVLAYLIFCTLGLTVGLPITGEVMNRVDLVMPDSEADRVGLKSGDVIVSINGERIESGQKMLDIVHGSAYKRLLIVIDRDGRLIEVKATPKPMVLTLSKLGLTVSLPLKGKATNRVELVEPGSEAEQAGFRPGDVIASIDGERIESGQDLLDIVERNANKQSRFIVKRGKQLVRIAATLRQNEIERDKLIGLLGFSPKQRLQRVGFAESVRYGNQATVVFVTVIAKVLPSREVKDAVGGPLAIADATLNSVKSGLYRYLQFMGILSLSLAVINLLPIPVVDGGQMVLLIIEGVKRRRLSPRTWELAHRIGWTIIAILFMLVMYLDVSRVASNKLFR